MYNTSQAYKDAVFAPARTVKGRVTFAIIDTTALTDINVINTTAEYELSDKAQITNLVRDLKNWSTWEKDRTTLDGAFAFSDGTNLGEVGFVSDGLSENDQSFTVNPNLSVVFDNPHSSIALTVTFDQVNNEYAEDFVITAYDDVGGIILSESYVGNTETIVVAEGLFQNYYRIDLQITKWSHARHRARVAEIDFGAVRIYDGDNSLVSMNLVEDVDYKGKVIPTSEVTFVVQNVDQEFNLLNPEGIYAFLQQNQQVLPEIGILAGGTVQYVPLGEFFLSEWNSDEGGATASFTASDILGVMTQFTYENLTPASTNIGAFIENLFIICGISEYNIDSSVYSISTNGLIRSTDCRTALNLACIAGMVHAYTNRDGEVIVEPWVIGTAQDQVTRAKIFKESQISLEPLVKTVEVQYWSDLSTSGSVSVATGETTGEILTYTNNTLINDSTQATTVANWAVALTTFRAKFVTDFRGDPAYELLDTFALEDLYGTFTDAIMSKLELKYKGYLRGTMETRAVLS